MNKLIAFLIILCSCSVLSFNNECNFVKNSKEISLKLLNVLPQNENHLYSPLSITYSLYALLNGADGQTEAELRNLLNNGSNNTLQSMNSEIKTTLNLIRDKNTDEMVVQFSNRILVSKAHNLTQTYQNTIKDDFNSSVDSVDFMGNAINITQEINNWIKEQTKDKIPKLFHSLPSDSVMVMANALYFQGKWAQPFNERSTIEDRFYGLRNETTVQMMRILKPFKYRQCQKLNATLVNMPFTGESNLSMIILLPNERNGINQLIAGLDTEKLNNGLNELANTNSSYLNLFVPRFELETDYNLKTPLTALGVTSIFDDNADLSHITGSKNLKVSQAVHKAVIKVKEAGVEAAAALGIVTVTKQGHRAPTVTVDRPFLFLIQDTESGLILFLGKVCDL